MKIKLDENLPFRLGDLLKDHGHDSHSVHEERLVGHNHREIWEAAQKESRFLITQDLDFSDSRKFVSLTSEACDEKAFRLRPTKLAAAPLSLPAACLFARKKLGPCWVRLLPN
jgi:hypothetical protein